MPFILGRQKQLLCGQWQSVRDIPPDAINCHKVIFSVAYALSSLHERNRVYGKPCVDDVFVHHSTPDRSQIYKLIEKDSHWYQAEAYFEQQYAFNWCLSCYKRNGGTLDNSRRMAGCKDSCSGYYCKDCLKSFNIAQFCPLHGPKSKGLKFFCSKCKCCFGTAREWMNHSACAASVHCEASAMLKIGTWNVTSMDRESDLLWILLEMNALKLDILGLSETKWIDSGIKFTYELNGENYCIITSTEREVFPKNPKGVAWIVRERWHKYIDIIRYNTSISNRVLTIKLPENEGPDLVLTQIYSPTSDNEDEQKAFFCKDMELLAQDSVISGDFNETILSCDYCCLSRTRLLSEFCWKNGFVISNMWPSTDEPVTKAQNDFILVTSELWLTKCVSSSKNFLSSFKSDHPFPVVASLKFNGVNLNASPKCESSVSGDPPFLVEMSVQSKKEFQDWYHQRKVHIQKRMEELKNLVRQVLNQSGIELITKDWLFVHPAADNNAKVDSVCGRLVEMSFRSCLDALTGHDEKQLASVFNGTIDKDSQENLVRKVKQYKKLISDTIKEGRTKWDKYLRNPIEDKNIALEMRY